MKDALKQFVDLKSRLTSERESLMRRLAQINQALADDATGVQVTVESPPAPKQPRASKGRAQRAHRGRGTNPISLREAVVKVTSDRPLTKKEIVDQVQKLGYTFRGRDPMNVLGTVIYGKNPNFKNEGGRFSPLQ
jgi:hypothetical protein